MQHKVHEIRERSESPSRRSTALTAELDGDTAPKAATSRSGPVRKPSTRLTKVDKAIE